MTDNRNITKAERLRGLLRAGKWRDALSLANSFGRLGTHAKAIRTAHDAAVHPGFYKQLGKNPDALVADGVDAMLDKYLPEPKENEHE